MKQVLSLGQFSNAVPRENPGEARLRSRADFELDCGRTAAACCHRGCPNVRRTDVDYMLAPE